MSRSRRKAIYKDKGWMKSIYHKVIRRNAKQCLHQGKEIPNAKTIVNDYDYSDYTYDGEYGEHIAKNTKQSWLDDWIEQLRRK